MSTYTPIASITLASAASSVTFSGIPQTYTDLVLVPVFTPSVSGGIDAYLTFNGDSSSGLYSKTHLAGYGSGTAGSTRLTGQNRIATYWQVGPGDAQPTQINYSIMNYANTVTNKTVLARAGAFQPSASEVNAFVGLWRNTNAITSITLTTSSGNFASGSTFNLYGIANASITNVAKATGGDIVTTDGTYWYHAFLSSGTFTPTQALTCDVLQIAGGGGGGYNIAGGGGAGGISYLTSQALSAIAYSVTVGAGGTRGTSNTAGAQSTNGNNSQFGSLTAAVGGGYGGNGYQSGYQVGGNGGSGGGGSSASNNLAGGTATSGQGNNGGASYQSGISYSGGGGGGAGAAGAAGTNLQGGAGGAGVTTYSAWGLATGTGQNISGTVWFAGGAGGNGMSTSSGATRGLGGNGGGGNGGQDNGYGGTGIAPTAGTANTGGGGGAGGWDQSSGNNATGANGGSGIVIVRYSV